MQFTVGELATAAVLAAVAVLPARAVAQERPRADEDAFYRRLVAAAVARAEVKVRYVPDYVAIPYPGGDVPAGTGVCTDEIVRIYRAVGIDLQRLVHEDVSASFAAYPSKQPRPDANIDHRRVPMLMTFLARMGAAQPITRDPRDYRPGDVVAWGLKAGHVGMVIDRMDPTGARPLVLHNVGRGPEIEDALFSWPIIGHYRWAGGRREVPRRAPPAPGRSRASRSS